MGRGSTDKQTIKLQNYLRHLSYTDRKQYELLEDLLTDYGYIVYMNDSNVLMVRKPKHILGLDRGAIHLIVTGADIHQFMKGNEDE